MTVNGVFVLHPVNNATLQRQNKVAALVLLGSYFKSSVYTLFFYYDRESICFQEMSLSCALILSSSVKYLRVQQALHMRKSLDTHSAHLLVLTTIINKRPICLVGINYHLDSSPAFKCYFTDSATACNFVIKLFNTTPYVYTEPCL